MLSTYSIKKGFTSVSLLPLSRSSYVVTMTHYDVILILFLFRFVANVQDLKWENFLVLIMNKRGIIRIFLPWAKMTPLPTPHRVTVAQTYLVINIIVDPVSKNKFFKILADLFNEIKNMGKT